MDSKGRVRVDNRIGLPGQSALVNLNRFALLNVSKAWYCTLPGLNTDKQWRVV